MLKKIPKPAPSLYLQNPSSLYIRYSFFPGCPLRSLLARRSLGGCKEAKTGEDEVLVNLYQGQDRRKR